MLSSAGSRRIWRDPSFLESPMNITQELHDLGQSLWLDNLSRELTTSGTLARYIRDMSLTGLTSNPTIFDKAIGKTPLYDATIRDAAEAGRSDEEVFFALALEDLGPAATLFRPAFAASKGADGWVSMEVSPLLAYDTAGTVEQVKALHARAALPNLFIKIPGTPEGIPAIEECVSAGIPINVTLLFSAEQYVAAAGAYQRAAKRRLAHGKPPVRSVASLFVSRWDVAVSGKVPENLRNRLGVSPRAARPFNVCCGRAREPKIRAHRMSCTSRRSSHPIRSTRCRMRPCSRSRITAKSAAFCLPMAATATPLSRNSRRRGSIRTRSPNGCNAKARSRSANHGTSSWRASRPSGSAGLALRQPEGCLPGVAAPGLRGPSD